MGRKTGGEGRRGGQGEQDGDGEEKEETCRCAHDVYLNTDAASPGNVWKR